MATLDRGRGRFDRRVTLLKPTTNRTPSASNPFGEKGTDFTPFLEHYPARRLDSLSEIDEKETGNLVRAVSEVEWHLVYSPALPVKADWRLYDEMDKKTYLITSPITEMGRGTAYRVIATLVE